MQTINDTTQAGSLCTKRSSDYVFYGLYTDAKWSPLYGLWHTYKCRRITSIGHCMQTPSDHVSMISTYGCQMIRYLRSLYADSQQYTILTEAEKSVSKVVQVIAFNTRSEPRWNATELMSSVDVWRWELPRVLSLLSLAVTQPSITKLKNPTRTQQQGTLTVNTTSKYNQHTTTSTEVNVCHISYL